MVVDVYPPFYPLSLLHLCFCFRSPSGFGALSKISPGGEEVRSQISEPARRRGLAAAGASASGKDEARYYRQRFLERRPRSAGENARRGGNAGREKLNRQGTTLGHRFKSLIHFLSCV